LAARAEQPLTHSRLRDDVRAALTRGWLNGLYRVTGWSKEMTSATQGGFLVYSGAKSGTHLIGCLECSPGPDARSDREGTWESDARQAVVDTRVGVSTVSTCVKNRVASDNVR